MMDEMAEHRFLQELEGYYGLSAENRAGVLRDWENKQDFYRRLLLAVK